MFTWHRPSTRPYLATHWITSTLPSSDRTYPVVWDLSSSYIRWHHGFRFWKSYRLRKDLVCSHVCVCVHAHVFVCACLRVLFFILYFPNIIFYYFIFIGKTIGLIVSWYLWLMELFLGFHILLMFRWSYFHAWNLWLIIFI
jgi:hypothetical protein